MPTAARLVAAACFAGLAYLVSGMIVPLLPDGTPVPFLGVINALLGVICGWKIMGPRAGHGVRGAVGIGITTSVALALLALFLHSAAKMIKLSLRKYYDNPTEAVVAIFEIGFEYAKLIATTEVIGTALVGGVIAGFITNAADRRWN